MTSNKYNIESIIESFKTRKYTNFISRIELAYCKKYLHFNEYEIFELFDECNKVILYKKNIPKFYVICISSKESLRHQDCLGAIYSLGIKEDTFSDIVEFNKKFYFCVIPELKEYVLNNLLEAGHKKLELIEVDKFPKYEQKYKRIELIVSSLRIDNVVSTLTNNSRGSTSFLFKNGDVILNYIEAKPTRVLQEKDTFSIRRFGKYKYNGILKNTKKGGYIIELLMYI